MPYVMGKEVVLRPKFILTEDHYCGICGELMLAKCQECGAEVKEGNACTKCGHMLLVPLPLEKPPSNLEEWAETQRKRNREIVDTNGPIAVDTNRR